MSVKYQEYNSSRTRCIFEPTVNSLTLALPAFIFGYDDKEINLPSDEITLTADSTYRKELYLYVTPDGWLLDEVLQDGNHLPSDVEPLNQEGPVSGLVATGHIEPGETEIHLIVKKSVGVVDNETP